jgi:hypothetical protein
MIISKVSDRTGIIQSLEDLTGTQNVSSYSTAVKLKDINLAFDDYSNLVKQVSSTWQADDSSHTKYPNMYFNLVSGQGDYSFTEDEQGNQVQDIYRVECMMPNGTWKLLTPVDEMAGASITEIEAQSGTPTEYWKTANGIFLKVKPNYSQTNGIRMFFTRSPNYFTAADVTAETKEPGIPNGHHKYLFWKPAFWYWLPKDTARAQICKQEVDKIEAEIMEDISNRNRDEKVGFRPRYTNYN